MSFERDSVWEGLFYKRGSLDFPRQVPNADTFRNKIPEHVCSGNCNRFDTGEVLEVDWLSQHGVNFLEIISDQSFEALSSDVQQFLISIIALSTAKDAEVVRTNLMRQ